MPYKDYRLYLQHIAQATTYIQQFLGDMTAGEMRGDRRTEAAVERELQIVTEAAARPGDEAYGLCPGPDRRSIRGLGNVLRHGYDQLNADKFWEILTRELPELRLQVEAALRSMPAPKVE